MGYRDLRFQLCDSGPESEALRRDVRSFLRETLGDRTPAQRVESWDGFDPAFSRQVGERGWIGMTWPEKYGGHARSAHERNVVCEEMLAGGAPVSAHWVADRQTGPLLLRFGTEKQRLRFLPTIARGQLVFALGMSEPEAGSDLAAVRTRAERVSGGYTINGSKVWITNGHRADFMTALFRTQAIAGDKHAGLSQFLVDMSLPGITVRPIRDLSGAPTLNEVVFDEVFVPDDMLLGEEGAGWKQVRAELTNERIGPERYLTTYALLLELVRELSTNPTERGAIGVGRLVAHLTTLRQMFWSVIGLLEGGEVPNVEAALAKEMGNSFEQEIPEIARLLVDVEAQGKDFQDVFRFAVQKAPAVSLRAGTREVMRGIVAAGLGFR